MELIENHNRNEFQPVIMQQLRMIFTQGNDLYDKDTYKKRGITKEENSFSLFDLIGDVNCSVNNSDIQPLRNQKIFPKIKFAYRDYNQRITSNNKYYHFSDESIVEQNKYTFKEFLSQPYIEVETADGQKGSKNVEQCIKILANKFQGAHYQVYIRSIELNVIGKSEVISQTLGRVTANILLPICMKILLEEDKLYRSDAYTQYFNKSQYINFNVHHATPLFED